MSLSCCLTRLGLVGRLVLRVEANLNDAGPASRTGWGAVEMLVFYHPTNASGQRWASSREKNDRPGCPVAVEVFERNTGDPKTLTTQIEQIRRRLVSGRVVLVGDRGRSSRKSSSAIRARGTVVIGRWFAARTVTIRH